jgi:hypothetical protein
MVSRRFSPRKAIRALGIGVAVLAGAIALEIALQRLAPPRAIPTASDLSARFALDEVTVPAPLAEDAFMDVARRPLFWPDRGQVPVAPPPVVEAAQPLSPPPPPPPPPPQLVLVAIVSTPDIRLAILRRAEGGDAARVKVGETFEGWTLDRIYPDHIEIGGNGAEMTLYLLDSIPKQAEAGN